MCTLYRMTSNVAEIARVFGTADAPAVNLPLFEGVYPDRDAPVVRQADGARRIEVMRWGFPPPPGVARPVVNVRNLASPFWRSALVDPARRCLVPVTGFVEWTATPDPATGRKRKVWFGMRDPADSPFAFAGIWRPVTDLTGTHHAMAFLTCAPNALVGAVHPKAMPVILPRAAYATWLDAPVAEATALAVPFDAAAMQVMEE
jgi:putative SOS response-associated peptidase YedK